MLRIGFTLMGSIVVSKQYLNKSIHVNCEANPKQKVKVSELPIYDRPVEIESKYEILPEEISSFRSYISQARKSIWEYLETIEDSVNFMTSKYDIGKSHTKETLAYIQEDSAVLPKAALITVAGLGGIVAGFRGGVMKKSIYAIIGMSLGATVCYPNQAYSMVENSWDSAYNSIHGMISDSKPNTQKKSEINQVEFNEVKTNVNELVEEIKKEP